MFQASQAVEWMYTGSVTNITDTEISELVAAVEHLGIVGLDKCHQTAVVKAEAEINDVIEDEA